MPHSPGILHQSGQSNMLEFLADIYVQENQEEGLALKPEAGVTFEVCSRAIRRLASSKPPCTTYQDPGRFQFSCMRQDEFLSQSMLQTEMVSLLGRNSAVPGIYFVREFNMEIH